MTITKDTIIGDILNIAPETTTERKRTGRDGSLRPGLVFRGAAAPGRRTE